MRRLAALCFTMALGAGCGGGGGDPAVPGSAGGGRASAVLDKARSAVADPLRPAEDRARDADRRPAEVLAFFGIDEGMRVVDLQATRGYYSEILSTLVGPDGHVYVQNNAFVLERFAEEPLAARLAELREAGRDNLTRIDAELDEMELPDGLDAALFIRFYHDLFWLPAPDGDRADRAEFLRRVYEALKPGACSA